MTTKTAISIVWNDRQQPDYPGVSEGFKSSKTILRMYCKHAGHACRLTVCFIPADGIGRRENGGPVLPGPYASTFANATVIDNFGGTGAESRSLREQGLEFDVEEGDIVLLDGEEYVIRDDVWLEYPHLYPVKPVDESRVEAARAAWAEQQRIERAELEAKRLAGPVPDREIRVGLPATHHMVSDSYASVVTKVERFKSGARQGQVKAIESVHVDRDGKPGHSTRRHLSKVVTRERYNAETRQHEKRQEIVYIGKGNAFYDQLVVGWAVDYRDPEK